MGNNGRPLLLVQVLGEDRLALRVITVVGDHRA